MHYNIVNGGRGLYIAHREVAICLQNGYPYSDIPVTETQTDTEMIDISKTHTETNTEKIFNTDIIYI